MNVNELSNIVKKESDIYRDTALFNYESISNEDATIESGTVNLSSTNCLNLLCQTTHKMTDRDLINVQNELDNNYTRIEEMYEEYLVRNNSEEEEDIHDPSLFRPLIEDEFTERFINKSLRSLRNVHYSFVGMDSSSDEEDFYFPKKQFKKPIPHPPVSKFEIVKHKETNFFNSDFKKSKQNSSVIRHFKPRTLKPKEIDISNNDDFNISEQLASYDQYIYVSLSENHPLCCIEPDSVQYKGCFNLGNTCYINSCLIVLFHFYEFRNLLESAADAFERIPQNDLEEIRKNQKEEPLLYHLLELFQALSDSEEEFIDKGSEFCDILNSKRSFRSIFFHSDLRIGSNIAHSQNDARNFFEYLLDQIKKEIEIDGINYAQELMDLMYFHTCTVFETYSHDNPQNLFISLSLSSTTTNIIDCIEEYFKDELVSNGENNFEKRVERLLFAQTLFIFGLNRFTFSLNTGRPVKICYPISIPDAITITENSFDDSNKMFVELQLYAVIVHTGQSANSGHYYSYVKPNPYGQWYCFNDSRVTQVDINFLQGEDVLRNAYIVIYKNGFKC